MRPEVLAAYIDALRRRRQPVVDPRERAGRARAARDRPRAGRRVPRGGCRRGRASPAAAPRRSTSASRACSGRATAQAPGAIETPHHRPDGRTPRHHRLRRVARRPRGRDPRLDRGRRAGPHPARRARGRARRRRRRGRARHGDLGEQRGRHDPAGRRDRRGRARATACPCTSTRSPPTARCRSTSTRDRVAGRGALRLGAQDRRPGRHRRPPRLAAPTTVEPLLHGGNQQRAAPEPRMPRAPSPSASPPSSPPRSCPSTPRGSRACATGWWPASARPSRRRCCAGDPDPRAGRLPGNAHFTFDGLRGRLAAVPARRGGFLGLDRVRLPGGRAGGLARAAGDGPLGGRRARRPALHPRHRHDRMPTSTPCSRRSRARHPGAHRRPRRPHHPRALTGRPATPPARTG